MTTNFLSEEFAISPQITLQDIADLKSNGFRSVFCHRPNGESPDQPSSEEIEDAALAYGLHFRSLPVVPNAISERDVSSFKEMLEAAPKPILAYCKTGGRAKILWERTVRN